MKIIYVSGPYVGDGTKASIQKNIDTAKEYASAVARKGIGYFCPHIINVDIGTSDLSYSQRYYYDLDAEFLVRSDAVLAMPGWEKSFGAKYEIEIAKEMKMPIFYPKSPDDIQEIVDWNKTASNLKDTREGENIDWDKVVDIRSKMAKYVFAKTA